MQRADPSFWRYGLGVITCKKTKQKVEKRETYLSKFIFLFSAFTKQAQENARTYARTIAQTCNTENIVYIYVSQ